MINVDELGPRILFYFGDGSKFHLSEGTCYAFILAVILAILGIWMGSGLEKIPKGKQVLAEALVGFVYGFAEKNVEGKFAKIYAPYLGSLIVWLVFANSTGLIGLRPITADINITAGLAVMSFFLIQGGAIHRLGVRERVDELGDPFYIMVVLNLISELVLPMTLALRLFGNIFGGMIVVDLWMSFMEFLSFKFASIPILRCITVIPLNLFFDVFEPIIQAYIFTMLTAINLGEGLSGQSAETAAKRQLKRQRRYGTG